MLCIHTHTLHTHTLIHIWCIHRCRCASFCLTYTHTKPQPHINTRIQTHPHTYTHTLVHMLYIHIHTLKPIRCMHICRCLYIHTHTLIPIRCVHICRCASSCLTYTHTNPHPHINTRTHTPPHTYTHIRTHTYSHILYAHTHTDTHSMYTYMQVRLFLSGFDLTPTYRNVNNKFSVKYYLNLVLVDEEDRRYFKQQVRILKRRLTATGWCRVMRCLILGCLIFIGHFPQSAKRPIISGSFAENDLQLKVSYESSHPVHVLSEMILS